MAKCKAAVIVASKTMRPKTTQRAPPTMPQKSKSVSHPMEPREVPSRGLGARQQGPQLALQLGVVVGLGHKRAMFAEFAGFFRRPRCPGGQDDLDSRSLVPQPLGKSKSIHAA